MGCLLGIWPLIGLSVVGFVLATALVFEEVRQQMAFVLRWDVVVLGGWDVTSNLVAQLAAVAFAAVLFGGEYRWRTWKNIVPHRRRVPLLLTKYLVLGLLIVLALVVVSVILAVGMGLVSGLLGFGDRYFTLSESKTTGMFVAECMRAILSVFVGTVFIGSMVGLVTLLTRSMLVGALGGVVVLALDGFSPTAFSTIVLLTDTTAWLELLRLRFMYNLHNAGQLLLGRKPASPGLVEFPTASNSLPVSLLIVVVWLVVMVGLTLWVFQRQDLAD
jgi:ABC-type transport system involved in multi-copper enzyme maturation permease subunit